MKKIVCAHFVRNVKCLHAECVVRKLYQLVYCMQYAVNIRNYDWQQRWTTDEASSIRLPEVAQQQCRETEIVRCRQNALWVTSLHLPIAQHTNLWRHSFLLFVSVLAPVSCARSGLRQQRYYSHVVIIIIVMSHFRQLYRHVANVGDKNHRKTQQKAKVIWRRLAMFLHFTMDKFCPSSP